MLRNLQLSIPVLLRGNSSPVFSLSYPADLAAYYSEDSVFDVAADNPLGSWGEPQNSYTATQGTSANKPTLRATTTRVEFDGTSDFMSANGAASIFSGTDKAFTVFVAANVTSVAATMQFLSLDNSAGNGLMEFRSNAYYIGKRDDANAVVSATVAGATTGVRLTVYACSGTVVSIRNNGVVVVNEAAFDAGVTTLNVLTIGRRADVGANFFTGDLYRLAIYNRRLTNTEIAFVESQWNAALGLY